MYSQPDIFTTAEQARKQELIFARGIIDVHITLGRKDDWYNRRLAEWADNREQWGDTEVAKMARDALADEAMAKQFDQDQAAQAASEDV